MYDEERPWLWPAGSACWVFAWLLRTGGDGDFLSTWRDLSEGEPSTRCRDTAGGGELGR